MKSNKYTLKNCTLRTIHLGPGRVMINILIYIFFFKNLFYPKVLRGVATKAILAILNSFYWQASSLSFAFFWTFFSSTKTIFFRSWRKTWGCFRSCSPTRTPLRRIIGCENWTENASFSSFWKKGVGCVRLSYTFKNWSPPCTSGWSGHYFIRNPPNDTQ